MGLIMKNVRRPVCGCTPGTPEDGWQERRADACVAAELAAWGDIVAWLLGGDQVHEFINRREEAKAIARKEDHELESDQRG